MRISPPTSWPGMPLGGIEPPHGHQ